MDGEVNNRNARIAQDVKRDNTDEHRQTHKVGQTQQTQETDNTRRTTRDGQHETDNTRRTTRDGHKEGGGRLSVGIRGGCWDRWRCTGGYMNKEI